MAVSERLAAWVVQTFPAGAAERVLEELRQVHDGNASERLQASLVIRTNGDWDAFQYQLRVVAQDWRDALVNAGVGDGDWPHVLDGVLGPRS
ncbi:MAG TPA: hypothetical protein VNQ77_14215 [Frankiaceae bacterium]|nr:hypothetical protein [Frankiaceae bacterium]